MSNWKPWGEGEQLVLRDGRVKICPKKGRRR